MPALVSVVVVSRGRPVELDLCITALCQLSYRPYEVIVVADDAGQAATERHAGRPFIRVVPNEADGVAAARNVGLGASSGQIIAFLDDDAVPEPTWLDHLAGAFDDPAVGAATGYVRGRNGISWQWRGRTICRDAHNGQFDIPGARPVVPGPGDAAVMLEGTNMALRRALLDRIGGFDSSFRFFLDDADMALRASVSGYRTAIVPLAEVHHAFAASERRRADRMPTDLFDNGRSLAVFVRKHAPDRVKSEVLAEHRGAERRRLLRAMVAGLCEPPDVTRLLETFDAGLQAGLAAEPAPRFVPVGPARQGIFRTDKSQDGSTVLFGRPWSRRKLKRAAAEISRQGQVVSVFRFSPTGLYHRVRYDRNGYWEQTGGLFGRSERGAPLFRVTSFAARLQDEVERVAKARGIQETAAGKH